LSFVYPISLVAILNVEAVDERPFVVFQLLEGRLVHVSEEEVDIGSGELLVLIGDVLEHLGH